LLLGGDRFRTARWPEPDSSLGRRKDLHEAKIESTQARPQRQRAAWTFRYILEKARWPAETEQPL